MLETRRRVGVGARHAALLRFVGRGHGDVFAAAALRATVRVVPTGYLDGSGNGGWKLKVHGESRQVISNNQGGAKCKKLPHSCGSIIKPKKR